MRSVFLWGLAVGSILLVVATFFGYFYDQQIVDDIEYWSYFGSYVGGTLGPLLSFLTVILLIKTLELQTKSTDSLETEVQRNQQQDKLRSFESHFFNMLDSQKKNFDRFSIQAKGTKYSGTEAVNMMEHLAQHLKDGNARGNAYASALANIDGQDNIYNCLRMFFVISKIIDKHLSSEEGFEENVREKHYETLIFFTDYSLLRLLCIAMIFHKNTEIARYMRNNQNLRKIGKRTGLSKYLHRLTP